MAKYKRRIKLIKPSLQMRLTLIFVGMSALSLALQFVLFLSSMSRVALALPNDGAILWDELNGHLLGLLGMSFLAFLPLTFGVGILTTFRIAGPIYRFELFLKQVIAGDFSRRCGLREGDQLHDFCDLLNQAVDSMRARIPESEGGTRPEARSEGWSEELQESESSAA